jgi:O-antigen ligase
VFGIRWKNAPIGAFFLSDVLLGAALVCFVLSWLVPLHFLPWVSWHSEVVTFCSVLVLAWYGLLRVLRSKGPRCVDVPFAVLPFIALALAAVLQRATGLMTFWGDVWAIWFYVALAITCLILGFAAASPSAPHAPSDRLAPLTLLTIALLVSALASSVIAFVQVFGLWEQSWISGWISRTWSLRRPGGNLAQPNLLATLLVMGVAGVVYLHESAKLGRIASGMLLVVLGLGLVATESRAGVLEVFVLLLWWLAKRRHFESKISPWVAWVAVGVFTLSFMAWPMLLNSTQLSYQAEVRNTSSLRWEVWPQLLDAVRLRPWSGWGISEVAKAHNAVAHRYAVSGAFTYSHTIVLDLMLWVGLPLTGIFALVTGRWLWNRIVAAKQLLPWYCLAVALPVAVHSMVEFSYAYANFLAPAMFALGASEALSGAKPLYRMDCKPIAALLLVCTSVLVWSVIEYVEIEEDFRVARFEELRVGSPPAGHQKPKVVLYTQLKSLLDVARITPRPDMSGEVMQILKQSALRYPWAATQYRYAMALALNGNPVEAARQIQVMRLMWGETLYNKVKLRLNELAGSKYPELRRLHLP